MISSINKTFYRKGESELYIYSSCPPTLFRSTHTVIVAMFQLKLSIKDDDDDDDNYDNEDGLTWILTLLMTMVMMPMTIPNCDDDDGVEGGDFDGDDNAEDTLMMMTKSMITLTKDICVRTIPSSINSIYPPG